MIEDRLGWDHLELSIRFAEDLTRSADDGLEEVVERYPAVRRFAPTFLSAFAFRTARSGDPLLGAVEALRTMYRDGRSVLPSGCRLASSSRTGARSCSRSKDLLTGALTRSR